MVTNISHSPEDTEALGESWGQVIQKGWTLGLSGDLGAGKTRLVKGLARGLGAREKVHSPTFVLINEYPSGRLSLFHLDLYRLTTLDQVHGAGLEDYLLNPPGISVVEWIEHWLGPDCAKPETWNPERRSAMGAGRFPRRLRLVRLETLNDTDRRICHEDFGD